MCNSRININLPIKVIVKIDGLVNYRKKKYTLQSNYGRSPIINKILQNFFDKFEDTEALNKKFEGLKNDNK